MTTYGLTEDGFHLKPLDVIAQAVRDRINVAIGMVPTGALGDVIDSVAIGYSELWELTEGVNAAQDPDAAVGAQQDAVCAITGTNREPDRPSEVDLTLTGTPTTLVIAGSQASALSTGIVFETLDDATIASVPAYQTSHLYSTVGDRVTNVSRVYQVITAGTSSSGSGSPTTTSQDITDGTVHWRYVGEGTGAVDVAAQTTEDGPLVAAAGDVSVIVTPVSGWQTVVNLLDADVGADVETNEDLRVHREDELFREGEGSVDAIRATLLDVEGVTAATVFHNPTDVTDGNGLPPHSVRALVTGGADQDIFDALLSVVAAGIRQDGVVTGTAEDDEGNDQPCAFTRPDEIEIYVVVNLTYDADVYPADGNDLVEAALVLYGDGQKTGRDAVSAALSARVFDVAGVLDVPSLYIGLAPAPSSSVTIPIALDEIATYDTSRITIVSTPGTP
jgi:uncharacterized phage protein gp47/JayE